MNELELFALYRVSMRDRRITEETTGRMYSGLARAIRRLHRAAAGRQTSTR